MILTWEKSKTKPQMEYACNFTDFDWLFVQKTAQIGSLRSTKMDGQKMDGLKGVTCKP